MFLKLFPQNSFVELNIEHHLLALLEKWKNTLDKIKISGGSLIDLS